MTELIPGKATALALLERCAEDNVSVWTTEDVVLMRRRLAFMETNSEHHLKCMTDAIRENTIMEQASHRSSVEKKCKLHGIDFVVGDRFETLLNRMSVRIAELTTRAVHAEEKDGEARCLALIRRECEVNEVQFFYDDTFEMLLQAMSVRMVGLRAGAVRLESDKS